MCNVWHNHPHFFIAALYATLYASDTEENAKKTGVVKGDSHDGTTDGDGRSLKVGAFRAPWLENFHDQSFNGSISTLVVIYRCRAPENW